MGTNVKYLASVKTAFWLQDSLSANAASDGMISSTWEGTNNQPGPGTALIAFSGGPAAETCRTKWAAAKDKAYEDELSSFYARYPENFVAGRFMDWPSEEWTGAGYSFPAPGQIMSVGPILHRGLGRLHFAGEHACYKFVGYMEGALNSGATLARRLGTRDGVAQSLGLLQMAGI
jgi:monoamine oxidase